MSKIIRLHYFDTYEIIQGHRRFTKIGFEAEIDDEFEDVRDVFYRLKRKSEELFYEAKGAAEKQMGTHVIDLVEEKIPDEIDKDFEHCKKMLAKHKFREDAQEYLNDTGFKFNLECKTIVNNLPSKNDKK